MNVTNRVAAPVHHSAQNMHRGLVAGAKLACGLLSAGFAFMVAAPASATVTFTFSDALAVGINTSMDEALLAAGFATASASASGAIATNSYNGDGHVIPGQWLGPSTFIINNGPTFNAFSLTFTNFIVTSVSFNFEIFPDASCQKNTACATNPANPSFPDLTFTGGTVTKTWLATYDGIHDPQAIGTSGSISLGAGTSVLNFADWPAEIGIANLVITGCVPGPNGQCPRGQAPEPSSLALIGLGLGVFGFATLRAASRRTRLS